MQTACTQYLHYRGQSTISILQEEHSCVISERSLRFQTSRSESRLDRLLHSSSTLAGVCAGLWETARARRPIANDSVWIYVWYVLGMCVHTHLVTGDRPGLLTEPHGTLPPRFRAVQACPDTSGFYSICAALLFWPTLCGRGIWRVASRLFPGTTPTGFPLPPSLGPLLPPPLVFALHAPRYPAHTHLSAFALPCHAMPTA
jgi:hypothetical protein